MAHENPVGLLILSLAAWRVASMLHSEKGPFAVFERFRLWTYQYEFAGELIRCFYCLSVWVAMPFAIAYAHNFLQWFVNTLAISAAVISINAVIEAAEELG